MGLDITYMHAKFDHCSVCRSEDRVAWVGAHQNVNGSGIVCHPWASTWYEQPTKFEFSISTHYDDTKCDTKYHKWDGVG